MNNYYNDLFVIFKGLRQFKSVTKMDVSIQFNYMTPSIGNEYDTLII